MSNVIANQFINPIIYTSAAVETVSLVTGASPVLYGAKLLGMVISNASVTSGWAQVFDGNAAPSAGAAPMLSVQVAAGAQNSLDCSVFNHLPVKKGIVVVLSSTLATYTAISSGLFITAAYVT